MATQPLSPPPAAKAVAAVKVGTEPLVSQILFVVTMGEPAVILAQVVVAVAVIAVPPENVLVFRAPKLRLVVISDVGVHKTAMFKNLRGGGVMMQGGYVMAAARQTIGRPVLGRVEMVRKPTTVEQRAHAVLNAAHTGPRAVRQRSPELPHMIA